MNNYFNSSCKCYFFLWNVTFSMQISYYFFFAESTTLNRTNALSPSCCTFAMLVWDFFIITLNCIMMVCLIDMIFVGLNMKFQIFRHVVFCLLSSECWRNRLLLPSLHTRNIIDNSALPLMQFFFFNSA